MTNITAATTEQLIQLIDEDPTRLARLIDHTLLKPDATEAMIAQICREALRHHFFSVCVNPTNVRFAASQLAGSNVKVCAVVGFPLGATTTKEKVSETQTAIENGATEIDMVINIGAVKSKDDDFTLAQITAVTQACHEKGALCKVIIETSYLTNEEKVRVCQIAKVAGADFVKTSTGFSGGGATVEDVALMRHTVGQQMGVKASGGIRSLDDARRMVAAGANRLGLSSGVRIMQEAEAAARGGTEILGVAEAVLYVTDIPRARQFYTEVLGLPVSSQFEDALFLQTGQNSTLILFDINKLEVRESVIPSHGARGQGHVCLAIPPEQMDGWRARLLAHEIEIEHEQDWSLGTHSLYFRDPDGNSLELMDGRHYRRVWRKLQEKAETTY
ncbi:MAG: deoxyribose-phosphate aldolase [Ardenticatenaceae bacterium]|nr:deoxyribose-phosphate aldolase [Ardenticatenaceae bacterium]